jgi:uncharacterized protein YqjF (DUF2071 family)
MTNVAPRGLPNIPGLSAFPELNVRTYVRVGRRPGVFFFSLDAASAFAVFAARLLFGLPYYRAAMHVTSTDGVVRYESRRLAPDASRAVFAASYRPLGPSVHARVDTLEYFLTERYRLYAVRPGGHIAFVDIHHPPWPIHAAQAELTVNTMATASNILLPDVAPHLSFVSRQDVVAWPLRRVSRGRP